MEGSVCWRSGGTSQTYPFKARAQPGMPGIARRQRQHRQRPGYRQARVLRMQSGFGAALIGLRMQIQQLGVGAQRLEAMGESRRDVQGAKIVFRK